MPYIRRLSDRMAEIGIKHGFYHLCGEQNANLPFWSTVPMGNPGIVSLGHEVDLEVASQYFPGHILMGNIEPALIQVGTPEQVYAAAKACILKGRKHPAGFILAPGCELPPLSPEKNVWAIMQAVSDHGWYE
jgi:uroporphyrinogen decarboxylase